jgi:integrase
VPWLYLQKRSANWWIGYRVNGKAFFRSTGTPIRADAERQLATVSAMFHAHKAASLNDDVFEALTGNRRPRVTLAESMKEWLQEVETSASAKTADKYARIRDSFQSFLGATEEAPLLRAVTPEQVRSYLSRRFSITSASTANLERKILAAFFTRAVRHGLLRDNPVGPIKPFKQSRLDRKRRRPFTVAELRLIYSHAPNDFWRFMVLGGFYTALRMGDLVCLVCGAFDFADNLIRVTARKTDTAVTVPLHPRLRDFVVTLKRRRGRRWQPASFVWPDRAAQYLEKGSGEFSNEFHDTVLVPAGLGTSRTKKRRKNRIGGRGSARELLPLSFHCLRHSFISLLKAAGGNQAVAKELAGHSSDLVNDDYTTMPVEVLARAIKRLPAVTK